MPHRRKNKNRSRHHIHAVKPANFAFQKLPPLPSEAALPTLALTPEAAGAVVAPESAAPVEAIAS